ncbi:Methyltransferase domain-containing protein [Tenacibaculum sp. MAR_2009_124]|uniref:class I SAM-dependent methyltransferase n=1 Tax=Tenacibaculum sp. MAR_2009_124 TaxID=1250059 RepID=UPI00089587E4|nr:class I SAM-dependent methyltransferase [Tenacibaculum sp. MAR_2009_124]SEC50861.1 Methyltransferase domain-containing protein [Tenacibaculum sp. MAR_2009_124]
MELTKEELQELENQLSCPTGDKGIETAILMNNTNIGMTKSSIDALHIANNDVVLELGHGNCGHLDYLLKKASKLSYIGLEISETMKLEAQKQLLNKEYFSEVSFKLYDGKKLPLEDKSIQKIFTVNTLYFWKNPTQFLEEISRVLSENGICIVTFAQKDFMQKLPFVGNNFKLYNTTDIELLVKHSSLRISQLLHRTEKVKTKTGILVDRHFTIAILKHKS